MTFDRTRIDSCAVKGHTRALINNRAEEPPLYYLWCARGESLGTRLIPAIQEVINDFEFKGTDHLAAWSSE